MFYEFQHSLAADYFNIESGVDFEYPEHLHHCFEFLYVTEGEMHVEVDELSYDLREGDALMIFSNQVHSMKTFSHSKHILCLFSPKLISAYSEKTASTVPEDNHFRPSRFYIDRLMSFTNQTDCIKLKGLLYSLCGELDSCAVYRETDTGSNILLLNIFKFVELNYNKNCALASLAKSTGYDYAYLSRYFKKSVGMSYNDYVSQYRISKACYLLQNSEMTVLEVSNECGFNSLRSLNRNFKEEVGMTPAEYRKQLRGHSDSASPALNDSSV